MHANHVELVIVLVFPETRVTEVGIIEELTATLSPANGFRLGVPVDDRRVCQTNHTRQTCVDTPSTFEWVLLGY